MADSLITISSPVATIVDAISRAYVATLGVITELRATASQASRDEDDHIRQQMYWDMRETEQKLGLVGEKITWPSKPTV